ncbi:MAG: mannonate dehydratase [Porticoccaceae bacterium]|nr:mannonate dehydratase [Porticoccaceae bacterium]MAA54660.1 mannonate dehydratase [Porticoccaceae bacterium]
MLESWRWFGSNDPVSLDDIRQTGAQNVVTALHHIPIGDIWTISEIKRHQSVVNNIERHRSSLHWSLVESIPVHESIKLGRKDCQTYIGNWITSMENLAKCGIKTICYNFMPVIDWTRTDLKYQLPNGSLALCFDHREFSAFDLYILQRPGAKEEYSDSEIKEAKIIFNNMSQAHRDRLTSNIICGLPGGMSGSYDLKNLSSALANYQNISHAELRENLHYFLSQVVPSAEESGVKLALHPDDPPRNLLGLPRIASTKNDLDAIFSREPSPANGLTLCVGSLGSRFDNDVASIAKTYATRIYFAHLRTVKIDRADNKSFYESNHLEGDVNMIQILKILLQEERRRSNDHDTNEHEILFRPDHGHQMMDDIGKIVNPGYSAIGRLRGLAELRGAIRALSEELL